MNNDPYEAEIVDAEIVAEHLPARNSARLPVIRSERKDPDAWLSEQTKQDIKSGIAENTNNAYKYDMEQFAEWCESVGRRAMPAASESVAEYMSYLRRTPREATGKPYSPRTMDRIIASIRSSHRAAKVPPPDTMAARKVVAGYRRELSLAKDPAARPQKVSAADRDVLREALARLDRNTLVGKRDAALMLLGHDLASRGSELVPLDWPKSFRRTPDGGFVVDVYRKKRKMWQAVSVPLDPEPDLCAVRAIQELVAALEEEGHHEGPLFLRMDRWGFLAPPMQRRGEEIGDPLGRLTVEAASDIVQRSIERTEIPGRWRSHSTRMGFVKSARTAGVDIVQIGRHGGWDDRSKALIGYVDEMDAEGENNPLAQIGKAAVQARKTEAAQEN